MSPRKASRSFVARDQRGGGFVDRRDLHRERRRAEARDRAAALLLRRVRPAAGRPGRCGRHRLRGGPPRAPKQRGHVGEHCAPQAAVTLECAPRATLRRAASAHVAIAAADQRGGHEARRVRVAPPAACAPRLAHLELLECIGGRIPSAAVRVRSRLERGLGAGPRALVRLVHQRVALLLRATERRLAAQDDLQVALRVAPCARALAVVVTGGVEQLLSESPRLLPLHVLPRVPRFRVRRCPLHFSRAETPLEAYPSDRLLAEQLTGGRLRERLGERTGGQFEARACQHRLRAVALSERVWLVGRVGAGALREVRVWHRESGRSCNGRRRRDGRRSGRRGAGGRNERRSRRDGEERSIGRRSLERRNVAAGHRCRVERDGRRGALVCRALERKQTLSQAVQNSEVIGRIDEFAQRFLYLRTRLLISTIQRTKM